MLSHKKYMEIQNLNPEIGDMFEPGDQHSRENRRFQCQLSV